MFTVWLKIQNYICSSTEVNCRTAVAKGYIADLLKVYEDWHNNDTNLKNIPIRRALLHCMHRAANSSVGRDAIVAEGGISLLFQTTQVIFQPTIWSQSSCYISYCDFFCVADLFYFTFLLHANTFLSL